MFSSVSAGQRPARSWLVVLLWNAVLAVAYFGAARLGLKLATLHGTVSPVWPATGVAIGALVVGGWRLAPAVLVGAFVANALPNNEDLRLPLAVAGSISLGNVAEALLGAWIVTRTRRWLSDRAAVGEAVGCCLAALAGPLPSAGIGVCVLAISGSLPWHLAGSVGWTWWVGDSVGALTVAPVIVASRGAWPALRSRLPGATLALLATVGVCALVFLAPSGAAYLFALFPVLLLAMACAGALGTRLAAVLISGIGLAATLTGHGPFLAGSVNDQLLSLQVFTVSLGAAALVLPLFRLSGSLSLPGSVLLVGWILCGWLFASLRDEQLSDDRAHFETIVGQGTRAIERRLGSYEDALRAGASLYAASEDVRREEWKAFSERLGLTERYPGISGLSVILRVPHDRIAQFLDRMRADGAPDFRVSPVSEDVLPEIAEHFVIAYIEPEAPNRRALGLDNASERHRREAAEAARDTGQARVTRRISLVQDGRQRAGFLLVVPLYATTRTPSTIDGRRAELTGWISASFITEDFLEDVLVSTEADLTLFDGPSVDPRTLLYTTCRDGVPESFEKIVTFELGGMPFTAGWVRSPKFNSGADAQSIWTATSLALVTLLLAGLVRSLQSTGRRAAEIAESRTAELKRAQADLEASNRLQRAVLDGTVHSIIATDVDGTIRVFNSGAEKMLGYRREEVVGKVTPAIIHLGEEVVSRAGELSAEFGRTIEPGFEVFVARAVAGEVEEREWTYVRKDGTSLPVSLSVTALRDRDDVIHGFLGIAHDLTERRRALEDLQVSQKRLSSIFDAVEDGLVMQDTGGTILECNGAAERILGLTREQMMGRTSLDARWRAIHEDGRDFPGETHPAIVTLRTGESQRDVIMGVHKPDGGLTWISICSEPVRRASGEIEAVVCSLSDVTDRRQIEINLARSRDAALEASRLKSEFLATVSHEIRTPMNGIMGTVELLLDSRLNPRQDEMARIIRNSADNLMGIINDILDFSKIEAGKLRLDSGEFDLSPIIEETVALLAPRAHAKGVDLLFDVDPGAAETGFWGDAGRIRQIIANLVGNAVKFTEKGAIVVEARCPRIADGSRVVRVSVRDTGVGIPDEARDRLFQTFSQVDGSTTRHHGGTGLGLAISRQLVEMMRGRIDFTSVTGAGSEFWFEVELPERAPCRAHVPGDAFLPAGLRVLVIDDNASARDVVARQLGRSGCRVTAVADRTGAMKQLGLSADGATPFDLVVMDWQLAGVSGVSLVQELRTVPGAEDLPMLILSFAGGIDETAVAHIGRCCFRIKPVSENQLKCALVRLHADPLSAGVSGPAPVRAQERNAPGRRLHLLVAEDNPANQVVAQMLLENLGHTIEIAENGQAVLEALAARRYDAVLMDCQMPVMDGYEAARRIRSGVEPRVNSHIPIIALTAFAQPQDRVKCREAGMDDYITKPIRAREIREALERCGLDRGGAGVDEKPPEPGTMAKPVMDLADDADVLDELILSSMRDLPGRRGPSLLPELVEVFVAEVPARVDELRSLARSRSQDNLSRAAHTLAGSSASLGARHLRAAALALEGAAKAGEWSMVESRIIAIEHSWRRVHDALSNRNLLPT